MARETATQEDLLRVSGAERFKEQVRSDWTDAEIVAGWDRWYVKFAAQSRTATEALIGAAGIRPGMQVLDLASGPGDPAITLAERVGPTGHITAIDLSPGMVAAAAGNARREGVSNITCEVADAEALPFPDRSFDAVTCRFGIMFCPDAGRALREAWRVLRPGGRAAFVVWGAPSEQSFIAETMDVFAQYTELPTCEIGAPNPFSFAEPGTLTSALRQAGFDSVEETHRPITMPWPGPPEEYGRYVRETAAPVRSLLAGMSAEQQAQVMDRLVHAYRRYSDGQAVSFPSSVIICAGQRAS